MQIGVVGLGRMGGNIVRRLMQHGHQASSTIATARRSRIWRKREREPAAGSMSSSRKLQAPRAVWIMLPAGEITEAAIAELADRLDAGDIIIDGGNTFWQGRRPPRAIAERRGMHYVDVGTSGGIWGLERGYCMMIGGDKEDGRAARSDLCRAGAGAW